ncbi:hypothetical protein F2Q70_00002499 [Brassica cretica]|uniref:Uncharacterized protein n=1 Tax=Brassica cretica TaxID=69181 RepID=A0A8S9IZP1_BRACR|nr:hypothetical protein F2Q70_00002499 [Brassica cretica]
MDGELPTVRLSPYFDTGYSFELAFQCHRSQVNQHPVADVMHILLKSGQSASREEAAEKRKPRRSMQHSARRSMEFPDHPPVRSRAQIDYLFTQIPVGVRVHVSCDRYFQGQSASCSRCYARFTEEWSVYLARGICREEEATSINAALCTSIDGDPRSWALYIL